MVLNGIKISIAASAISVGSWLSFGQVFEKIGTPKKENVELKVQVTQLEERIQRLEERFSKPVKPKRRQAPLT